jgi:hypothetical protein
MRLGTVSRWALMAVLGATLVIGAAAAQGHRRGPFSVLDSGKIGNEHWIVGISRSGGQAGKGPKGLLRPCLTTAVYEPYRAARKPNGTEFSLCVVSPILRATGEPLILERGDITPRRDVERKMTAVAIAFAPGVATATLTNYDGDKRTLRVRHLGRYRARYLHLARLGYVVFAVRGPYCVDSLVAYAADGRVLFDWGKPDRCPPQEFPDQH